MRSMHIDDNHFGLFGLPERFDLDIVALDAAYRALQSQVHPDRFARSGAAEQRVALQWATRANEAYRVLRDPLKRAIYLCTLRGADPADEDNTAMPPAFLMQQIEWREALDEARDGTDDAAIDALRARLDATLATLQDEVALALAGDDVASAVERVRQWMFVDRFGADVRAASARRAVH